MRLQSGCLPYRCNTLLITSPAPGNTGKKGHCFMAFMITSLLCFFLFSVDITLATMTDRELVVDQHFHSNQNTRSMTVRSFGSGTTGVKWLKWSEEISPDEPEQAADGHYAIHLTFTNSSADHDGMVQEGLQSLSASNPFMSIIRVTETQEGQLEVHLQLSGSSSAGLWLPGWKYDPRHSGFSVDTAEDAPVRSFELVEYSPEYSDTKAEDSSAEDTASFATSAMVPDDYASPDEIKPETPGYSGYDNDADDTLYPPRPGGRPLPAYLWLESDEAVLTVPGMGGEKKRQTVIFVVLQAGGNSHRKEITYEEYKMLARLGLHKSSEMLYLLFHDSEAFRQQVNALNKTLENLDLDWFMLLPYLKKIQSFLMAADNLPFIEVPEVIILTEAQARYKQSPKDKDRPGGGHCSKSSESTQSFSGSSGRTGNPGKDMGKDKDGNGGGFYGRPIASVPPITTQLCERRETGDCVGDVHAYRTSGARNLYLCQMHRSQQEPAHQQSQAAGIQSQTNTWAMTIMVSALDALRPDLTLYLMMNTGLSDCLQVAAKGFMNRYEAQITREKTTQTEQINYLIDTLIEHINSGRTGDFNIFLDMLDWTNQGRWANELRKKVGMPVPQSQSESLRQGPGQFYWSGETPYRTSDAGAGSVQEDLQTNTGTIMVSALEALRPELTLFLMMNTGLSDCLQVAAKGFMNRSEAQITREKNTRRDQINYLINTLIEHINNGHTGDFKIFLDMLDRTNQGLWADELRKKAGIPVPQSQSPRQGPDRSWEMPSRIPVAAARSAQEDLQQPSPDQRAVDALIKNRAALKLNVNADTIINYLILAAGGFLTRTEVRSVECQQSSMDKMEKVIEYLQGKVAGGKVQPFLTFTDILRRANYLGMADTLERDAQITGSSGEPGRVHTATAGGHSPGTRLPLAQARPGGLTPLIDIEGDMLDYFIAYYEPCVVWVEDNPAGLNLDKFAIAAGGFLNKYEIQAINEKHKNKRIREITDFLQGKSRDDFLTFIRLVKESGHLEMIDGIKKSLESKGLSPLAYGLLN